VKRGFTLGDLPLLAQAIRRLGDCRLVIIDPISAFMAQARRGRRRDGRTLMSGLATVADHLRVAMVLVTHLSKTEGNRSIHRIIGSVGVAGSARSVWLVARDRQIPQRRLLTLAKCNMTADETGLAYRLENGRLVFESEPLRMNADELLAAMKHDGADAGGRVARQEAEEWLRELLVDGALPAGTVGAQAEAAGLNWRTVQRAADRAGVIRRRMSHGVWEWRLAEAEENCFATDGARTNTDQSE